VNIIKLKILYSRSYSFNVL